MDIMKWNNQIKNNFNKAANDYSNYSVIQKYFAKEIIAVLKNFDLKRGNWYDLGSGPGFLADQIEKEFPQRNCKRVDFCENMLAMNRKNTQQILWDLNKGLPPTNEETSLIVSNFCIHWLYNPERIIKNWFLNLIPGGILIVTYPTDNSFPEWKETCKRNNIEYSGMNFPRPEILQNSFLSEEIIKTSNYSYRENFPDIFKLFRNIINVGAHTTLSQRKTVRELKIMQKRWPKDIHNNVNLTWEINILVVKKL